MTALLKSAVLLQVRALPIAIGDLPVASEYSKVN